MLSLRIIVCSRTASSGCTDYEHGHGAGVGALYRSAGELSLFTLDGLQRGLPVKAKLSFVAACIYLSVIPVVGSC